MEQEQTGTLVQLINLLSLSRIHGLDLKN